MKGKRVVLIGKRGGRCQITGSNIHRVTALAYANHELADERPEGFCGRGERGKKRKRGEGWTF